VLAVVNHFAVVHRGHGLDAPHIPDLGTELKAVFFLPILLTCNSVPYQLLNRCKGHPDCRWRRNKTLPITGCQSYTHSFIASHHNGVIRRVPQINSNTIFNPLNAELNLICYLLALLGAHHFLHVSRIRVKSLTFRLLMSYIYGAPILDVSRSHTTTHHSR